jgi:hypothetical protein
VNIKKTILPAVDVGLAATSAGMDLIGRVTPWGYAQVPEFSIDGSPVRHFIHRYNAFYPPYRMTERTIELALADIFLRANRGRHIVEIGAVTPYYWPDRVQTVVDPADDHVGVTHHIGWDEWETTDEVLLSMSTFEHIGSGEYGLAPDAAATQQAIDKLLGCGCDFLMTYPAGYNSALDAYVTSTVHRGSDYRVMAWHRGPRGNDWRQVEFSEVTPAMETYMPGWAQTLVALYRGPADMWSRTDLRDNSAPAN